MTWSFNSTLMAALRDGEVRPVYAAVFRMPTRTQVRVLDYTLASGITFTGTQDSDTSNTLTEGVDFSAGASNAEMATNLAAAINSTLRYSGERRCRARAVGTTVTITPFAANSSFTAGGSWASSLANLSTPRADFTFTTGKSPMSLAAPEYTSLMGLSDMKGLTWQIEPRLREIASSKAELVFVDDGQIRQMNLDFVMRGRPVDVYIGAEGLAFSDYEQLHRLYVDDVRGDGSSIIVTCRDGLAAMSELQVSGQYQCIHPLDLIYGLAVQALGSNVTNYFDSSTLTRSAYPNISHWNISRWEDYDIAGLQNALSPNKLDAAVNEILQMLGGTMRPSQAGVFGWYEYDSTASAVDTWACGPDSGFDATVPETISVWDKATNDCTVNYARGADGFGSGYFQRGDDESQRELDRLYDLIIDCPWVNSVAYMLGFTGIDGPTNGAFMIDSLFYSDSTEFVVVEPGVQGFAGSRFNLSGSTWTEPTGADLNNTTPRRAYLKLEPGPDGLRNEGGVGNQSSEPEIIACHQSEVRNVGVPGVSIISDYSRGTDGVTSVDHPGLVIYYVDTSYTTTAEFGGFTSGRAGFGTTTPSGYWAANDANSSTRGVLVTDVTIPVEMVQSRLRRFRYGAPELSVRTGLERIELEVGDFVALDGDDVFVGLLHDGIDSSIIWEITSKTVDALGDDPGIEWTLCWVRDSNNDGYSIAPIDTPTVYVPPTGGGEEFIVDNSGTTVVADAFGTGVLVPLVRR